MPRHGCVSPRSKAARRRGTGSSCCSSSGAAIVLGAFGWLFACLAAVFLLGKAFGGPNGWVWAALVMAALHFAGVVALGLALKSRLGTPIFPITTAELKKDQEWLDQHNRTNRHS